MKEWDGCKQKNEKWKTKEEKEGANTRKEKKQRNPFTNQQFLHAPVHSFGHKLTQWFIIKTKYWLSILLHIMWLHFVSCNAIYDSILPFFSHFHWRHRRHPFHSSQAIRWIHLVHVVQWLTGSDMFVHPFVHYLFPSCDLLAFHSSCFYLMHMRSCTQSINHSIIAPFTDSFKPCFILSFVHSLILFMSCI